MIEFEPGVCSDLAQSSQREWLETNGIGGYASSTISGVNTRRYHGLLVAATTPPTGRAVLLAKFEETAIVNGKSYELSANQYPGAINPRGFQLIKNFRLDPFPVWTFAIETIEIEKSVFLAHGENTVVIEYKFKNQDSTVSFEIRPLVAFRNYHYLRGGESNFQINYQTADNKAAITSDAEFPALNLSFENEGRLEKSGYWYRNFEYERERERGFDFREDLYQPFVLKFDVCGETSISLVASTATSAVQNAEDLRAKELQRRSAILEKANLTDDFTRQLTLAADQFVVARGTEKSVIAGYHWFSDWGRDTMIALPGLTLAVNHPEIARSILLEFSRHVSQGMLPNRFPDVGETPEYNTVDATLWYFEAVRAYLEKTLDYDFVERELYEKLVEIIVWHLRGTRFNIHVDTDGLLCAGDEQTQLTWMDAKSGDTVFTPRYGKAVEIQALWYNALRVMQDLAQRFNDQSGKAQYEAMANLAQISFSQTFWNEAEECLYDCINGARDAAVRPNQIFAVSLTNSMLDREKAQKIVRKVESELLTPFGLRSLSPKDPKYRPRYEGDSFARDSAYHQGTVWAWLMGAFLSAYSKTFADAPDTQQKLQNWLAPFQNHLREAGINQISEIFDGDPPHTPRGCIAQAWSVAEILRTAVEITD